MLRLAKINFDFLLWKTSQTNQYRILHSLFIFTFTYEQTQKPEIRIEKEKTSEIENLILLNAGWQTVREQKVKKILCKFLFYLNYFQFFFFVFSLPRKHMAFDDFTIAGGWDWTHDEDEFGYRTIENQAMGMELAMKGKRMNSCV